MTTPPDQPMDLPKKMLLAGLVSGALSQEREITNLRAERDEVKAELARARELLRESYRELNQDDQVPLCERIDAFLFPPTDRSGGAV